MSATDLQSIALTNLRTSLLDINPQPSERVETMKIKMIPISSITPYEKNPRIIPESAVKKVADSIKEFGWNQPIVVDNNSVIIVGHTRYQAAKSLNLESVPVHVASNLTEEQVTAYRIADNRTGEESTWDDIALREEFSKIADRALASTGFDEKEIQKIICDFNKTIKNLDKYDPDTLPDESDGKIISKIGELYELGPHRLLCGDSTLKENVDFLLKDKKPDLFLCDPPFQLDAKIQAEILNGLDSRQILWLSGTPSVYEIWRYCTRKDYRWTLFWEGGASMSVPNDHRPNISCDVFLCFGKDGLFNKYQAINAFEIQTNCVPHCLIIGRQFTTHRLTPLAKPVRLFSGCIELLSERGDLVCDLFLSSGTTIIAAAKTGRTCYGIELSPEYCDVIRRRWTKFAKENRQNPGPGALD